MKEKLLTKFNDLQFSKQELLNKLENLSEEELNISLKENKWSIAQEVYHIYIAETKSVSYMQKKASDITQLKPSGILELLKSKVLNIGLHLPIKYKAPKVLSSTIPDNVNYQKLLKDWSNTREELHEFIEKLPAHALQMKLFRHPIIGLINMFQTLDFLEAHFQHHERQILRRISLINALVAEN